MSSLNIEGVKTFKYTKIIGDANIEFGRNIIIDDFVFILAKSRIRIGDNVHIACFSSLIAADEIDLGNFCAVSHGCRILTATDDFKDWGFGNSTVSAEYRNIECAPIKIGRFSIIGANSVVLPGVTIGEGATVGACSVVTRDLEPWGVYIGNKRVNERDKEGVLRNYEAYIKNRSEEKA